MSRSITKKSMLARMMAGCFVMVVSTMACVHFVLSRVEKDIVKSDLEQLVIAVEAGPLEFANLHSAEIASQQLLKLMSGLSRVNPGYVSVQIEGGEDFSQEYATWKAEHRNENRVDCSAFVSRVFNNPNALYSFRLKAEVDVCQGFPLIKQLKFKVTILLLVAFAIVIMSPFIILMPIGKSMRSMESVLSNLKGAEQIDSIVYEPLKKIAVVALNARKFEKDATIGRISAHLTHDMRAPIGTFERLLLTPDEDLPKMRGPIRESVSRLYAMVEALRYGESENLVRHTSTTLDFSFGYESLLNKANEKKITIDFPKQKIESISIDTAKVERAWINLATNAIEVTKTFVKVEVEARDADLILRVIDDGPGVPDDFLPRLFQRGATHGKHDGTGLGLAYVRQIMRGHGGDVTYRRENGFTIFECRLLNAIVENQEGEMVRASAATTKEVAPVKRVGVCFVPRSMAESLCTELASLKSEKFSFSTEYDGADFVATNDPDLALTATEEGKQPLEFKATLAEAVILDGLKRRFDLV